MSTHTPGPWRWEVNRSSQRVEICGGVPQFDKTVMSFRRWGMQSAAPAFWFWAAGRDWSEKPKSAAELAVPARGMAHHAHWFADIDHPDARLIITAPDLMAVVKELMSWADQKCPCHDETPDPCPLCGARSAPGGGGCKAADETLPPELLRMARAAIAKAEGRP